MARRADALAGRGRAQQAGRMELGGLRVILVGGTSHVGKSTVAAVLAEQLGWEHQSTDTLARHPGRPWQTAPGREEIVASHYESLTVQELVDDVLRHYENKVWPLIKSTVADRVATDQGPGLVLEGSALLPELVTALGFDDVGAAWLVADEKLLRSRIHGESGYTAKSTRDRALIDKFLTRTLRYNELLDESLTRFALMGVRVAGDITVRELAALCLAAAQANQKFGKERVERG